MSELQPQNKADFFGKDGLTPFIGTVEDINDPKRAGRVKVRCVGWHPYEKEGDDGLKTEDLPWARVASPTTHAQQGRVGGKHGLLVGSWVFGFYLDGDEAQDPMVISSFPFTAGTSDRDNRTEDEGGKKGTTDAPEGMGKVLSNPNHPNENLITKKENQGKGFSDSSDKAGDAPSLDDNTDGQCQPRESLASENRMKQPYKKGNGGPDGNHTSQCYRVGFGDGGMGSNAHATQDIQKLMQEMMPAQFGRIKFGDVSWEEFSGSFIDMQGVMSQVSQQITGITKSLQLQSKAIKEDKNNRIDKASKVKKETKRDAFTSIKEDKDTTKKHDEFHAGFESFLGGMKGQVMSMLKDIDNNEIQDFGSLDLSNMIMSNIQSLTADGLKSVAEDILKDIFGGGGNRLSQPGGFGSMLDFSMLDKYAIKGSEVHNTAGNSSQDKRTQQGSGRAERYYQVCMGTQAGKENVTTAPAGTGIEDEDINKAIEEEQALILEGYTAQEQKELNERKEREKEANKKVRTEADQTNPRMVYRGVRKAAVTEYVPEDIMIHFDENHTWDPVTQKDTSREVLSRPTYTDLTGSDSTGKGSDFITDDLIIDLFANMGFGGMKKSASAPFTTDAPEDALIFKLSDGEELPPGVTDFKRLPSGYNAEAFATRIRQEDEQANKNYDGGDPNVIVIKNPGHKYFFFNEEKPEFCFPSIRIQGYNGIPVPVVDPVSGELVGILIEMLSFDSTVAFPSVTVVPDSSPVGILTNDPDYDFEVGGFLIANTGFNYKKAKIEMIDKDTGEVAGEARAIVRFNGRIVGYEILNSGSGFKRLPEVRVVDSGKDGFGATLLPIISVISKDQAKPIPLPVQMIFCPAKIL